MGYSPSAFESEIYPSHKSEICTLCISPLQGADIRNPLRYLLINAAALQYSERASLWACEKMRNHFLHALLD